MAPLRLLVSVLAAVTLAASVPINKDENTFGYGVQNTTYDNEQSVCVVDDVLYRAGDSLASANACERCVCMPPDFVCSPMACPMSPGCRAVQRSGQCCPDYHCECELNGQIYQNGEKVQAAERPCHVCYCRGGYVVCAALECYRRLDCAPRYEPGACCPKYDHCPPLETINRKRPQFPVPTMAGDTDNHIHRTLLLDEDQQLDSTNTDERVLRLGEVSGATAKSNTHEIDLPQSDEAVKSEEQEGPMITEDTDKIKPIIQKEVISYEVTEAATESNSFEMLQTPNYSKEAVKDIITDEKPSTTSRTVAEIPGSTTVTIQPNLETITDSANEDVTDKTTLKLLESEAAANSEKVTQQFRTEMSENNGGHTTEFQNDLDVLGATERNTLAETNSFVKKSNQQTKNEGHLPTVTSFHADENLTEDPSDGQDISTASTVEYLTEGDTVNLEFQEHSAITSTVQPDSDNVSVSFDNEPRANEEFPEALNNVQNDFVTKEIDQTSEHSYTTQGIGSDSYTTESLVHHITKSHELETEARENQSVNKDQFDINIVTQKANEENDSTSDNEEKFSVTENEKAETQRTSPIITNIRVTDDDEFDGGIITDDDEESTDDNRPPITTDRIIYKYDKHDSRKPTTIEAFGVTDSGSAFDEKVSTTDYDKESSQTTTEIPYETSTGIIINQKDDVAFKSNNQHPTPTTEFEELSLSVDLTTLEGVTEETNLLSQINNETVNASSMTNATRHDEVLLKILDGNANNSVINGTSSESSKLISQESYKMSDDIESLPQNGSSVADYDKSSETAENLEVKPQKPTDVQSRTHISDSDASDTFIREEPPVLLFKDEMALHQMDVVVAEDEEEASSAKEEQTEKVMDVIPPLKMDNVTNDTLPSVATITAQTNDAETKKLLEKGYMTGFLNDQSGISKKKHNMSAEGGGDVLTTESVIHEESSFTENIDLTTTEDNTSPEISMESKSIPQERISAVKVAADSFIDAEHVETTTEITTEEAETFPTSEQPVTTEKVTEQPKTDVPATMISNYNGTSINQQSASHDSHIKAITGNSSSTDEAPKILPEVVSFRHNVSLSGTELQQNVSESRQEKTTPETVTLPESWLKKAEKITEEENTSILSTTDVTDATEEFTDNTTPHDFSNSAAEYSVHTENSQKLINHNTERSDNGEDSEHMPGSEDEGPGQTIKKRNFRSEDSENLDKHDLLVLQEFFRKLYHH
ncbi:serine-rich adhesin for platelets [Schistocerca serialis cubense]|uniref:serine-rich adhesin for platelets n=1 Tax=Schistocerca serialis cubense TaxID=2023355 RepID=UPI00214E4213|nr:serine-rich adhesin for platelets [Schistocerca serialis cubense]